MDLINQPTTLGKTLKTVVWVVISGAVTALIAFLSQHPGLFNPAVVAIVNIVLVAVKNFIDPKVANS